MYRCSDDQWVYVGTSSNNVLIPLLCKAIGRPEMFEDPAYFRPDTSIVDATKVYEAFRDAFLTQPSDHWLKQAEILDFPLVRVNRYSTIQEDEQAWANDYLERVTSPSGNVNVMPSSPIEMRSVGKLETVPAAGIGADTRRVLAELGYSDAQIEAMLEAGAAK
jgi:crotonobetainyl-CoA:carnitine CoA-transferase CaiB-like acyl-CoA transferase